jgi:hypothetical protein
MGAIIETIDKFSIKSIWSGEVNSYNVERFNGFVTCQI